MLGNAVNRACEYLRAQSFRGRASFYFESGHASQSEARELLERLVHLNPSHYFEPNIAFVQKSDAPPLQAADLLAWLARNAMMKTLNGKPVRRDFMALTADRHRIQYYGEEGLNAFSSIYEGGPGPEISPAPLIWIEPE